MDHLVSLLPGHFAPSAQQIKSLFEEYEEGTTEEAVIVKDIDKYELLVQALEYERDTLQRGEKLEGLKDLSPFFGVKRFIKTDLVNVWAEDIMKERELLWKNSNENANGKTE